MPERQADDERAGHVAATRDIGQEVEGWRPVGGRNRVVDFGIRRLLAGDDLHADLAGAAGQLMDDRTVQQLEPARTVRFADDDLGDVVGLGVGDEVIGDASPGNGQGLGTELLGEAQALGDAVALGLAEAVVARRLDIDRRPFRVEPVGDPSGVADECQRGRALADANEQPVAGGPRSGDGMRPHVVQHLIVDALCRAAQRQLAQGRQIAGLEIVLERTFGLMRNVDLAFVQALDEIARGEVDELDLVGLVEDAVRQRLAHADTGDPRDHVVEALDMLDVERRVDVDPGGDQLLDVEVALGMAAARCIGVREFVDEHQCRPARQHRVDVHLVELAPPVLDAPARNDLEAGDQRLGLLAAMRLDDADDDVDAFRQPRPRRLQHLVGLADPRCGTEKYLEAAAILLRSGLQQGFRRRPLITGAGLRRRHAQRCRRGGWPPRPTLASADAVVGEDGMEGGGFGGLAQPLRGCRVAQRAGDAGECCQMLAPSALGDEKEEDQVDRPIVDRLEIDRSRQASEQPVEAGQPDDAGVRNGDAGTDAGRSQPLARRQGIVHGRFRDVDEVGGAASELAQRPRLVGDPEIGDHAFRFDEIRNPHAGLLSYRRGEGGRC